MLMTSKGKKMKCISNFLAILAVFFFVSVVDCYAQTETVTVIGMSASREGAIENGLIQAVQQVKGVSLKAAAQTVRAGMTASKNGKRSTRYSAGQLSKVQMKSKGVVSGYEIVEEENADGLWNITLAVQIENYKTPGHSPASRRKLAIVGLKASKKLWNKGVPPILVQKLTDRLVQSRKFAVVDREEDSLYRQEKARWNSDDFALEEKAKLGMRLGADYVVTGTIQSFTTSSVTKQIEMTGESYVVERIAAEIAYKVIIPATMQVKWSSTVTYNATTEPDSRSSQQALIATLSNKLAQKICADLLQSIYPLKIIKVAGDMLYLNMGGVNVKSGQKITVYHLGELLVDPYTNESLGHMETKVASATIVAVKPKFAVAQVNDLDGIIAKGDVCRKTKGKRTKTNKAPLQRKASSVNYSDGGGVKLPFD